MKIILSRKGFDSGTGGVANPILPSGRLCMLPIPDRRSTILYRDIRFADPSLLQSRLQHLGGVVSALTKRRIQPRHGAHLDPDLRSESLPRGPDWRPLFGQRGAALGHLRQQGVDVGDLFLFYGWFRQTEWVGRRLQYVANAPDLHIIFGWLQIGELWDVGADIAHLPLWATNHCHLQEAFRQSVSGQNVLFVAQKWLTCYPESGLLGGGTFLRPSPQRQLSDGSRLRSLWRLPAWFMPTDERPPLTYHASNERWQPTEQGVLLNTVGRGQEFVLQADAYPESQAWLQSLFAS